MFIYFVVCKCFKIGQDQIFVVWEWFKASAKGIDLGLPTQSGQADMVRNLIKLSEDKVECLYLVDDRLKTKYSRISLV